MNDRRLEQMIRDALDFHPPEGMRERVLRAARTQLREGGQARRYRVRGRILAWAAAAFVVVSFGLDGVRQERIAYMTSRSETAETVPGWAEMRRQTEMLLVHLESGGNGEVRSKERG